LLDLAGIGVDVADGSRTELELDVFVDQPAKDSLQLADHLVRVEYAWLQHLLAAEREQLPRHGRRALGGLLDSVRVPVEGIIGRESRQHQLGVAADRHQ
jgi:hypothetical protein